MGPDLQLASIIKQSENIVFFGGAGVSTESGIPDFRGNHGLYTLGSDNVFSPEEILHHDFFIRYPKQFYEYYRSNMIYPDAKPNYAHIMLARLERAGKLSAVITQNIDGLHQKAGLKNVIELHGSILTNRCTRCGRTYGLEAIVNAEGLPLCSVCGGLIRPGIVLYGEGLPADSWDRAEAAVLAADLLIVGGTSLTVQPAASLVTDFRGDNLIIINRTRTPYDAYSKMVIREPIGEFFASLAEEIFS